MNRIVKLCLLSALFLVASPFAQAINFHVKSAPAPLFYADGADLFVKIYDAKSGQVISDAIVMAGDALDSPFENNVLHTDTNGETKFNSELLRGNDAITITAFKEGYHKLSIMAATDRHLELQLQPVAEDEEYSFLDGVISGWPTGYDSGTLELGLFLPSFQIESFLNFNPNNIISTFKVETDIRGKRMVPANVVFPPQSKRYLFFTIKLNKPDYKMPLPTGFEAHMGGIIGTLPVSSAVSAVRDKDYLAVINAASFTHVNWSDRFLVDRDSSLDLRVDRKLVKKQIKSKINNIPNGLDTISVSLVDPSNSATELMPMDIKAIKSGRNNVSVDKKVKLSALKNNSENLDAYTFNAVFNLKDAMDEESRSFSIAGNLNKVDGNQTKTEGFFNLMKPLSVSDDKRSYSFSSPVNAQLGMKPDYLYMNIYAQIADERIQGEKRKLIWTSVLPADATSVELPNFLDGSVFPDADNPAISGYTWEIVAIGLKASARNEGRFPNNDFNFQQLENVSSTTAKY